MNNKDAVNFVLESLKPIAIENNVEIADVELVKEGPNYYLRIYIEKNSDEKVDINDCVKVSRAIEAILDEKDPINDPYILEVSSTGLDRPLKKDSDYEKYRGSLVDIKLYKAVDKQKEFQGHLIGFNKDENNVYINCEGEEFCFSRDQIALCKLAIIF